MVHKFDSQHLEELLVYDQELLVYLSLLELYVCVCVRMCKCRIDK